MAKTATKKKTTQTGPEQHSFAAETARVLHLMIHALYTNRDIFLRELISNASDACDKLRYQSLTNPDLLGDQPELKIHIRFDEKAKTLTITDTGIGMNKGDLIANLGTIAKSGTEEFFKRLTGDDAKDVNLIGQFGVGFYSSFMVADRVTVVTRKAGETEAWCWQSDGMGSYEITPIVTPSHDGVHLEKEKMDAVIQRHDTPWLHRGTTITLQLKDDAAKDYLDRHKLGHIVSTYSDHVGFPITLTDAQGVEHTLNDAAAIWARPKSDITDEQYQEFYRSVAHSPEKPWAVLHNKAEGTVEYTSLLFIPGMKPFDLFHPERKRRVKLYVKRVFITDEGVELVPPYLRFLRGVVDSADLPLNISRETLQKSPLLDKIRDSITSRVLGELKKRAEKDPADYASFWANFGAALKEGLCEANSPREKILAASRFYSTHGEELTSLDDYKTRMTEGQEAIYYLTGDSLASLRHSPQIEGFKKRGIEVLLLNDHVDDFWPNVTMKYGELPFRSVMKAGDDLKKLGGEEAKKEEAAADSAEIATLLGAMKTLYGDAVQDVRTTQKLSQTPICLSVGEGEMDLRMERFLAEHKQLPGRRAKLVEINPTHPVIQSLSKRASHAVDAEVEDALWLLLDQAFIAEGEPVADASAFAQRLVRVMEKGLK